jgi:ribosomal protein S18 acetylase RimI-like enzyme
LQVWTIAELEGVPIGVVLLNPTHSPYCLELAYIGILESARFKGLGNHLMQHVANQTTAAGASRVTLAVDAKNIPAIKLYKKWNFKKTKQVCTMIRKLS